MLVDVFYWPRFCSGDTFSFSFALSVIFSFRSYLGVLCTLGRHFSFGDTIFIGVYFSIWGYLFPFFSPWYINALL